MPSQPLPPRVQTPEELIAALRARCRQLFAETVHLRAALRPRAVEKFYSVQEAALLLSFSERWVRDQIRAGALERVVQIGRDLRIPASSINALLERSQVTEPGIQGRTAGELRRRLGRQDNKP